MENYKLLTIDGIHTGLKNRSFSAKELAQEALRIAQEENDKLSQFIGKTSNYLQTELGKPDEDFKNEKGNLELIYYKTV